MSWLITPQQRIPTVIGEPFGGGYFAGYISHTADGNPTHALIVAPRATGATGTSYTLTTNLRWKTTNSVTAGTDSSFDGAANTAAMVTAGIADHPAAQFCVNLSLAALPIGICQPLRAGHCLLQPQTVYRRQHHKLGQQRLFRATAEH
jgi:hypothetical protein